MEPSSPTPAGPEGPPINSPETSFKAPETAPELGSVEQIAPPSPKEALTPRGESANQNAGAPAFKPSQLPQPIQPVVQPSTTAPVQNDQTATGFPSLADDTDVIEKEWVDKAKSVVEQTKSDPYMQEKEVSRLQADYLKKRYGKDIKLQDS